MFDLIEENLAVQEKESPVVLPPKPPLIQKDPVVITMPEKFRVAPNRSAPLLIIGLSALGVLIVGGSVLTAMLLLNQPKSLQAAPQAQIPQAEQPLPTPLVVATTTPTDASSTESVLADASSSSPFVPADAASSTTGAPESAETSTVSMLPPSSPVAGADTDNDNLTDAEEELYGTDPKKPDTNENTYLDGNEIAAGYDPASTPSGGHLIDAPRVATYKSGLFSFSLLHPQLWIAKPVSDLEREVVVGAANGEFISVKVEENPKKLTPREWATAYGGFSADLLGENRKSQFWDKPTNLLIAESLDGLHSFIAPTDANGALAQSTIIHLSYQLNLKQEISFLTTFKMIVNSLRFDTTEKK